MQCNASYVATALVLFAGELRELIVPTTAEENKQLKVAWMEMVREELTFVCWKLNNT
jgi:hypothetical protein